jgi:hypothetical protein
LYLLLEQIALEANCSAENSYALQKRTNSTGGIFKISILMKEKKLKQIPDSEVL